jgi:4-amino-4-deoxy-L-arabinose transferase-like glycosyltransferase
MRQPVYPLLLAASYWLTGRNAFVVFLLQGAMNLLSFSLACLLGAALFEKKFWPGAPLLLALYYPLWAPAAYCGTESLYLVLNCAGMFCLYKTVQRRADRAAPAAFAAASGFFLAMALLTRPAGLTIILLAAGGLGGAALFRRLRPVAPTAFLVTVAVVLLPWTIRNAVLFGEWTPLSSEGGFCLWDATLAPEESRFFESEQFRAAVGSHYYLSREAESRFREFAVRNIRDNPLRYLVYGVRRVARSWCRIGNAPAPWLLHGIHCGLLLFALVGFANTDRMRALFLLLPAVAVSVSLFFLHAEVRYIWPAMPFVLILSGQGMRAAIARLLLPHNVKADSA